MSNLVDRRAFSWTDLLARLEQVLPPGVHLVSIAPTIQKGQVALEFEAIARTTEEGLELVKALQARKDFADVFLTGLDKGKEGSELGISLRYVPEGRVPFPPGGRPLVAASASLPFWRQRLLPVVVAVLGLNLLVLVVFTLPRSWRLSRVASRASSLREEVARERALTAAQKARVDAASSNTKDVQRFYKEMVQRREESLLPTLQEIETMAHQPGLVAGSRGYTREPLKGVPLTRVAIKIPLEGSYQNLVGFLEKVERGKQIPDRGQDRPQPQVGRSRRGGAAARRAVGVLQGARAGGRRWRLGASGA